MNNLFDFDQIRAQFPALQQEVNGRVPIFLDGPGGTQVPEAVIAAMSDYLRRDNSNQGGRLSPASAPTPFCKKRGRRSPTSSTPPGRRRSSSG
jgi:selenocysteine lyase/cysteine desulfurase